MAKEVEVTKIKLQLGNKEIELSVEQARNLRNALDDLFGKEIVREVYHDYWHWWTRPYRYDLNPLITWTTSQPNTSGGSTATLCLKS